MKLWTIILAVVIFIGMPLGADAASITNRDTEVHQIKARKPGRNWVFVQVNPNGSKFFNCRHGCEVVLEKTGSSVQLETDADIVIKDGQLTVR